MEVEKEGCRLCGASEVRDGRSVCDVCLGFVERIENSTCLGSAETMKEAELGRPKKQKPQEVEVQTVEQEAPEPQLDLRVCDDCKEEFAPYRRGFATVTNVCRTCLQKKIAEMNLEKGSMAKAIRDGFAGGFILLDMRKYMPEMQKLAALAEEQLRSLKAQALWILVDAVRKAKARGVE